MISSLINDKSPQRLLRPILPSQLLSPQDTFPQQEPKYAQVYRRRFMCQKNIILGRQCISREGGDGD
jgi:hypothetical protein